jgi:hypothetical protein
VGAEVSDEEEKPLSIDIPRTTLIRRLDAALIQNTALEK